MTTLSAGNVPSTASDKTSTHTVDQEHVTTTPATPIAPATPATAATPAGQHDRTLSHGTPTAPLLGHLPLARVVPMDVHSMMDYANVLATGAGALMTDCAEAKLAGLALAGADLLVSGLTNTRLSVARKIPVEVHETFDYVWGLAAIAAPFVFGYWRKAPTVALSHVIAGAAHILGSLGTDYRSFQGSRT